MYMLAEALSEEEGPLSEEPLLPEAEDEWVVTWCEEGGRRLSPEKENERWVE